MAEWIAPLDCQYGGCAVGDLCGVCKTQHIHDLEAELAEVNRRNENQAEILRGAIEGNEILSADLERTGDEMVTWRTEVGAQIAARQKVEADLAKFKADYDHLERSHGGITSAIKVATDKLGIRGTWAYVALAEMLAERAVGSEAERDAAVAQCAAIAEEASINPNDIPAAAAQLLAERDALRQVLVVITSIEANMAGPANITPEGGWLIPERAYKPFAENLDAARRLLYPETYR